MTKRILTPAHQELADILEALFTSASREMVLAGYSQTLRERVAIKRTLSQVKAARAAFLAGDMLYGEAQAWATTVTESLRIAQAQREARS